MADLLLGHLRKEVTEYALDSTYFYGSNAKCKQQKCNFISSINKDKFVYLQFILIKIIKTLGSVSETLK